MDLENGVNLAVLNIGMPSLASGYRIELKNKYIVIKIMNQ
jgi:hypothetical protein